MNSNVLVTGIRSTGELHLGNYYGAMRGLIDFQETYNSYFFIADIHSLTTHPNPKDLRKKVMDIAKNYIAAGLNPEKSTFYLQSSIGSDIGELHTYLSMVMPLGELLRCPTFKEKAKKHPNNINYGLVGYPVLMAADILIHKGNIVPVGEDQLVHLEIARTIVRRFNQMYGEIFLEPYPVIENAVRIPSLSGKGKMAKSDSVDTYIKLDDSTEEINKKVRKAYSDPTRIYKHQSGNPTKEGCNIYHLHSFFTDKGTIKDVELRCKNAEIGCVECKKVLSESMNAIIEPFMERKRELTDDYINEVLEKGKEKAKESSQKVISEVRKAIGLLMI